MKYMTTITSSKKHRVPHILWTIFGFVLLFVFVSWSGNRLSAQADPESAEQVQLDQEDGGAAAIYQGAGTYQDTSKYLKYKGTWGEPIVGADGTHRDSNTTGSSVRLVFRGTDVSAIVQKQRNAGIARIIVKEVGGATISNKTYDLYIPGSESTTFEPISFSNLNPNKTYRITVKVTGTKNAASNNTWLRFDKFIVTNTAVVPSPSVAVLPTNPGDDPDEDLVSDPLVVAEDDSEDAAVELFMANAPVATAGENGAISTYENTSSYIRYTKNWQKDVPFPAALGAGSYAQSTDKGAKAIIKFQGSRVTVKLLKTSSSGKALIKVKQQGRPAIKTTKGLYKQGADKIVTATFNNLDPNLVSTLHVRVTGEKNANSSSTAVKLDKFTIEGEAISQATVTPGGPTVTGGVTPTEDPNVDDSYTKYEVPIGTKTGVTIRVGGGSVSVTPNLSVTANPSISGTPPATAGPSVTLAPNTPYVSFATKLYGVSTTPEISVRMKVFDLSAQLAQVPPNESFVACQNPQPGEFFIDDLKLTANTDGVYSPKPGSTYTIRRLVGQANAAQDLTADESEDEALTDGATATDLSIDTLDENESSEIQALSLQPVGPGTYDALNTNVKYKLPSSWTTQNVPSPGTGQYKQSSTLNAVVSIKFTGADTLRFTLKKGPSAGKAFIKLKEVSGPLIEKATKDLYRSNGVNFKKTRIGNLNPQKTYIATIRVTNQKNAQSAGTEVGFQNFIIDGPSVSTTVTGAPSVTGNVSGTPVPTGGPVAVTTGTVTPDGWIGLLGVSVNNTYDVLLKGPKQVGALLSKNVPLTTGTQTVQNFNWVTNPLEGGDVPDPSNNNLQDCVINANDLSLIKSRQGSSTVADLAIGDLDYNNIINGIDISVLTRTLSTRPDDQ